MAEMPQPRNVDLLLVSDVNVPSPCCSCRKKGGLLKCSGCKAVVYCSKECQEKGWNDHKQICNTIQQLLQDVNKAIEDLANQYGGVEELLEAPLVKDGHFRRRDNYLSSEDPRNFWFSENHGLTLPEKYDIARWRLIGAYAKCGKDALSKFAFRLAAENLLHMLRLSRPDQYRGNNFQVTMHKYCGWMVAGGMDQQALNFFSSVICFGRNGFLDCSPDEDIEGVSLVQIVKENIPKASPFTPRMWNHDFMRISIIKYKRIQALEVQRKEEEERWNTFMEGTESWNGESSVVFMLSGMAPVLEKIKGFVLGTTHKRIHLLTNQINDLLNDVNERNPKLIPGILDGHVQMVDNPSYPETDEDKDFKEFYCHSGTSILTGVEKDIHKARYGVGKYGHAWHIDKDCTRALRLFLETGNVMADTSISNSQLNDKEANEGGIEEMKAEDNSIPYSHLSSKEANGGGIEEMKTDDNSIPYSHLSSKEANGGGIEEVVSDGEEDDSGKEKKDFSEKVKKDEPSDF